MTKPDTSEHVSKEGPQPMSEDPAASDHDGANSIRADEVDAAATDDDASTLSSRPDDPILTPQLSASWALAPRHLALLGMFCLLTMVLNYLPLRGTDLWGHVTYGNWILAHRQLPIEDPFASLTTGMRVIDSAWLSQVTFAWLERNGGAEALSTTFALLSLIYFASISRTCFLQTRRVSMAWAGLWIALIVGFSRLTTIRPENFGAAGFGILLWLLARHRMLSRNKALDELALDGDHVPAAWKLYIGVFLVMLLWANFHGSFICGLAVLGCLLLGRVIETVWEHRDLAAAIRDPACRQSLLVLEVGLVATLINPYGMDLLLNSFGFAGNEVLNDVLEWKPLTLTGIGGREFALSWIIITLAMRHSRERVSVGETLMLGLFALLAASRLRMIGWYAAVVAVFLAPHLAEIWGRFAKPIETKPEVAARDNPLELTMGRSWDYSLIAMLMIWISFALSPLGRPVIGDEPREPQQIFDKQTPLTASAYLRENPPQSRIFNPQWWGDWLVWDGPPGLEPFVTTNMHLIPSQVWADYRRIMSVSSGWERALSRYRIDVVVLDQSSQSRLIRAIKRHEDWDIAFEDEQAVILRRVIRSSKFTPQNKEIDPSDLGDAEGDSDSSTDFADPPSDDSKDDPKDAAEQAANEGGNS